MEELAGQRTGRQRKVSSINDSYYDNALE